MRRVWTREVNAGGRLSGDYVGKFGSGYRANESRGLRSGIGARDSPGLVARGLAGQAGDLLTGEVGYRAARRRGRVAAWRHGSKARRLHVNEEVPGMSDPAMRRIVVGVDGSEGSVTALRWACREAGIRGVEVHAIHVREAPLHSPASYAVPVPSEARTPDDTD